MGATLSNSNQQFQCVSTYNLTNPVNARGWIYNGTDKFIIQFIIPVISMVGIVGNGAFLVMFTRLPKLRTSLSGYLASLAICDILFLIIANILYAVTLSKNDINLTWPADTAIGCGISVVLSHWWYFASVGFMTLISLERYFAICKPMKHIKFQGKKRNAKLISAVWVFTLAITISTVRRYTYYHTYCVIWPKTREFQRYPNAVGVCGSWSPYYNTYEGLLFVAVFILSALGNTFLYAKILMAVSSRIVLKPSGSITDSTQFEANRVRNQVARTLIINGIVFFICQIPYRIDNLDDAFDYLFVDFDVLTPQQEATVTLVGHAFLFLNSVVNPFIYVFSCRHYRQGILEAFSVKCPPMLRTRDTQLSNLTSSTRST